MKLIGWAGTALVIVAYVPQIQHLLAERCAWGIRVPTWILWLAASALLLTHCILQRDLLFAVVQCVNIAAIATTIFLTRRSNRICPYHYLKAARARKFSA